MRAQRKAYEVVYGHLDLPWITRASPEARSALSGLHALVLENPGAAVAPLREWIAREPLPIFFNRLTVAYNALGEPARQRAPRGQSCHPTPRRPGRDVRNPDPCRARALHRV